MSLIMFLTFIYYFELKYLENLIFITMPAKKIVAGVEISCYLQFTGNLPLIYI